MPNNNDDTHAPYELSSTELEGMIDTMSSLLFPSERSTAQLAMQLPVVSVMPHDGGWKVQMLDFDGVALLDVFDDRTIAAKFGREEARTAGGTFVLHRTNGKVQQTYHYDSVDTGDDDELPNETLGRLVHLHDHR